jgi:hypothetical protein
VVPAADKTLDRPVVGLLFKFIARRGVDHPRTRPHLGDGAPSASPPTRWC